MKLTEEMDLDNGIIPAEATEETSSSKMASNENPKPHSPTQNGVKHGTNFTNGITSLGSTPAVNFDENSVGFEVESYTDFNSSLSRESSSGNKGDSGSTEMNGNNHSSNGGDIRDKIFSDESGNESTHNSSHMSEEFQLRLSDDDSSHLPENGNSSTPFKSSADVAKEEDRTSAEGSKSNMIKELNQDKEGDVHQLKYLVAKNLETPTEDSNVEPEVPDKNDAISTLKSSSPSHAELNEVQKESQKPSSQPEKCTKSVTLEDAYEAELEAELEAEIAAELKNKDKVNASEKNDPVFDAATKSPSDKDSDVGESTLRDGGVTKKVLEEKSVDPVEGKEPLVIKSEKDIQGDFVSIKNEEVSLDCDSLPIKEEVQSNPLSVDSDEKPIKIEPFPVKCESNPIKIEESPVKEEEVLQESETHPKKSESPTLCTTSPLTLVKDDDPTPPSEKTLKEGKAPVVLKCLESSEETNLPAVSNEETESGVVTNPSAKAADKQKQTIETDLCEDESLTIEQRKTSQIEEQTEPIDNEPLSNEQQGAPRIEEQRETIDNEPLSNEQQETPQIEEQRDIIVKDNSENAPLTSEQSETSRTVDFHDESRSHDSEQLVSPDKEDCEKKNKDSNSASLSEPNSPFSDNSDCALSGFPVESDDVSDTGDGILNENNSDATCENDLIMIDEAESNEKSDTDEIKTPVGEKASSSDQNAICQNESSNFCDSTVLDASCTDDTLSLDCSNSANENLVKKGSRKRILSHSEDDSCDTFRNKKSNGLMDTKENNENSKDHDNTHKRPCEVTSQIDSKKLRICDQVTADVQTEKTVGDSASDPIRKLDDDASLSSVQMPSTNLPFLRKLHKNQLSQMSRSDLEELILQKMCEAITERSVIGELRLRCQALENRQEKENEKFNKLRKQMVELNIVMKKYMDNQRLFKPIPPIKVTRSVGLQVCPAIKPCAPGCSVSMRLRGCQQTAQPMNQTWPPKQSATPSKPESPLPDTSSQTQQTKQTPNKPNRPSYGPRPASNAVSSTVPPALVPTGSTSSAVLLVPGRTVSTPPRVQVPPLQQISAVRPRFSVPTSITSTSPQTMTQTQQKPSPLRQNSPQSSVQLKSAASTDVEIIDIEDDHTKKPAGLQISNQQYQHQQTQATNAAAQSLAGNSGMTVRLISPTQTIPTGYSNFLVPTQGSLPQKMIIASSPPGNGIRGNFKFVMKSNQGNVIIPLQSNGTAVTSSIVQIPSSAAAVQQIFTNAGPGKRTNTSGPGRQNSLGHPAPLPATPTLQAQNPAWKQLPPRPNLKIQHQNNGIVLSWNMALGSIFAEIESYQLFAYQEGAAPPTSSLWKKVGDVKALPLPMACTLTQFVEGHRYHFAVRAVDKHGRAGPFSQPGNIRLGN